MHFKLIIALTEDSITDKVVEAARNKGATGSTVISSARGEGMQVAKTFLGLSLETQRDVVLLLVEEHMCRDILEIIEATGEFEANPDPVSLSVSTSMTRSAYRNRLTSCLKLLRKRYE